MTAAKQSPKDIKVIVLEPYQVNFAGVTYAPGDAVEVPQARAAEWRQAGWVT